MMAFTLRIGESIRVGDVTIHLQDVGPNRGGRRVCLRIDAPREIVIDRLRESRDGYDHSGDDDLLAAMLEPRS